MKGTFRRIAFVTLLALGCAKAVAVEPASAPERPASASSERASGDEHGAAQRARRNECGDLRETAKEWGALSRLEPTERVEAAIGELETCRLRAIHVEHARIYRAHVSDPQALEQALIDFDDGLIEIGLDSPLRRRGRVAITPKGVGWCCGALRRKDYDMRCIDAIPCFQCAEEQLGEVCGEAHMWCTGTDTCAVEGKLRVCTCR